MSLIVSDALLVLTALAGVVVQNIANRPPLAESSTPESGEGNHLIGEQSAYLQQHAHNPIDWYPWGEEALGRAQKEDKPVFLSIGYSSCHWCHVMEQEVFEKEDVAAFMNDNYISIKVDREERPDLDAVYMEAVQAMTGRGGWPMSVFLTPDLKPFYGGTYFPHETFLTVVKKLHQVFTADRKSLEGVAHEVYEKLSEIQALSPGATPIDSDLIEAAARQGIAQFDQTWGGSQSQQKFPTPVRWEFLMHHYRKTGDPGYEQVVRLTLDQMGSGGIHDHVGGGFHRYTVEETWLVPHFEKMLYDNAQVASLYIEAAQVWDQPRYAEIARDTLDFLIRDMSGQEGAFYSSYDADSGGEEGSFYVWSPEEITAVAGPADGPALAMLLGVTPEGNFEGRNVVTRRVSPAVVAASCDRPEAEVAALFDRYQPALLDFRAQRTGPDLDKKIITSWNGLAIAALARAYTAFKHQGYLTAAEKAAHFLWTVHRQDDGRLFRSSNSGRAANQGIIDDYAFFALGLLELYQATGDSRFLAQGLEVIDHACDHFAHPQGGFYLTAAGHETPMGRHVPIFDSVLPSGNAGMLQALIRASALTGKAAYRDRVDTALGAYGGILRRAGLDMAGWLDGAEKHLGPYYEVVVAGDPLDKRTALLKEVFYSLHPSHAVLNLLPAGGADKDLRLLMPAAKGKQALEGHPTAFVCQIGSCKPPTTNPEEMSRQIMSGWKK